MKTAIALINLGRRRTRGIPVAGWYYLLLTLLLGSLPTLRATAGPASGTTPGAFGAAEVLVDGQSCSLSGTLDCITVELEEVVTHNDGSRSYKWRVTNGCNRAVSHVSFELRPGTQAASPSDGGTYQGEHNSYGIENTTNNPFYSIKFETQGEGVKNGASDVFVYTLADGVELPASMRVEVKYATTSTIVTLDTSDCQGDDGGGDNGGGDDGGGDDGGDNGGGDDGGDDGQVCALAGSSGCITVELLGVTTNPDGSRAFEWRVTNDCNKAVSNVAFGLVAGTAAVSPSDGGTYQGEHNSYGIENTTNNPFYSIKFETQGEGVKNGASDVFVYTLADGVELPASMQVQVKYSNKTKTVIFDTSACQDDDGGGDDGGGDDGGGDDGGGDDGGGDDQECLSPVDFELDAAGNALTAGQVIDDEFAAWGMTVTTNNPGNRPAMIFDSAAPTGGDPDLGTPNEDFGGPGEGEGGRSGKAGANAQALGKVLIISENNNSSNPDDNAGGGTIIFTFDHDVNVDQVQVLDVDNIEAAGTVKAYDAQGQLLATRQILALGDNSFQVVPVEVDGVRRLEVYFPGSGAVAGLVFCADDMPDLGSIGDQVFQDTNGNGVLDGNGDPGLSGVVVKLYEGNRLVAVQTTDANGFYDFVNLPAGTYRVEVDPNTLPEDYRLTTANEPMTVNLAAGQDFNDADFGYRAYQPVSVIVEAVQDNCDGTYTARFGYLNQNGQTINIPVGADNFFTPDPEDRGQPEAFAPGRQFAAFSVTFPAESQIVWRVGSQTATASNGHASFQAGCTGADLALTKEATTIYPEAGDDVTFTVTLVNQGPEGATGVQVRDILPWGLNYRSSEVSVGSYEAGSGIWTVGGLAAGGTATLTLVVNVDPALDGFMVENVAQVITADQEDPDSTPGNGIASEDDQDNAILFVGSSPPAGGEADLALDKQVDNAAPELNEEVTFRLILSNEGPDDATGVVVHDPLPYGLVFVSAAGGSYDAASGLWSVGELAAGASTTLEITTRVIITNRVANTAQVIFADQTDVDSTPGNGVEAEDDQDTVFVEAASSDGGSIIGPACEAVGTINALVFEPTQGLLFAGTESGRVHVSSDDGQNWPPLLSLGGAYPVRALAAGGGKVYAGALDAGVFVSSDGGTQWQDIGPAGADVTALTQVGTKLYAGMNSAVRVYDGTGWTEVGSLTNPFSNEQVIAVAYEAAADVVFASGTQIGVFAHDGTSWKVANDGLPGAPIPALLTGPNGEVLAATSSDGVYAWNAGTQRWAAFGTGLEGKPVRTLVLGADGTLLAGTRRDGLYRYDGGTWAPVPNLPSATVSAATADAGGEIFVGTPGDGLFRYADLNEDGTAETWLKVTDFISNATIQGLVVGANGELFGASFGHGMLYSDDGGACWVSINDGLTNMWTFALARTSSGVLFVGAWADGLGGIWRSIDNGASWQHMGLGTEQILSIAVDPAHENIIYAAGQSSRVTDGPGALWRSDDGGETWELVTGFPESVWALAIDPAAGGATTLYVGTQGSGVYRSTNGGTTFSQVGTAENGLTNTSVFDLQFGPAGTPFDGLLLAGTADGIFRFDAGTDSWSRYGTGSEGHEIRTIAFAGNTLYAGTWSGGILQLAPEAGGKTAYGEGSWRTFGLPGLSVTASAVQPDGRLVVGTEGRGVFLSTASSSVGTDVEEQTPPEVPTQVALEQNYPNPFNPQTTIRFDLTASAPVDLVVYDVLGRQVAVLVRDVLPAGRHQLTFDGSGLASGTYFYRLSTPQRTFVKTMVLVK